MDFHKLAKENPIPVRPHGLLALWVPCFGSVHKAGIALTSACRLPLV